MSKHEITELKLALSADGKPVLRRSNGVEVSNVHLEFRLRDGGTRTIIVTRDEPAVPFVREPGPILRCSWCCKDTKTNPCEHCENDMCVIDRTKPHLPEWSRHTLKEVECKICDRRGPYSIQSAKEGQYCDETNNPNIIGRHANNPIQ